MVPMNRSITMSCAQIETPHQVNQRWNAGTESNTTTCRDATSGSNFVMLRITLLYSPRLRLDRLRVAPNLHPKCGPSRTVPTRKDPACSIPNLDTTLFLHLRLGSSCTDFLDDTLGGVSRFHMLSVLSKLVNRK